MKNRKYIKLKTKNNRADLILNRPEKHNALNPEVLKEFQEALDWISEEKDIHFLVISGKGKSFCAGADIKWFASAKEKTKQENREEYQQIPELLKTLYKIPQITVAAVHGNVLGGANGIISACDFVVAEESANFAFGEIKLGIIPATIMPFVARRLSSQSMKKMMFTGERFSAAEARQSGLVDFTTPDKNLTLVVEQLIGKLNLASPHALRACKQLIINIDSGKITTKNSEYTANLLAELAHSKQGMEGLTAFLEKRQPDWVKQKTEIHT
jgi:methylglutaconyl-CoA hydratase